MNGNTWMQCLSKNNQLHSMTALYQFVCWNLTRNRYLIFFKRSGAFQETLFSNLLKSTSHHCISPCFSAMLPQHIKTHGCKLFLYAFICVFTWCRYFSSWGKRTVNWPSFMYTTMPLWSSIGGLELNMWLGASVSTIYTHLHTLTHTVWLRR